MVCAKSVRRHQDLMHTIFIHVQLCELGGIFIMGFVYVSGVMSSLLASRHTKPQQNLLSGLSKAVVKRGMTHSRKERIH